MGGRVLKVDIFCEVQKAKLNQNSGLDERFVQIVTNVVFANEITESVENEKMKDSAVVW